jgi:hypothetical protein
MSGGGYTQLIGIAGQFQDPCEIIAEPPQNISPGEAHRFNRLFALAFSANTKPTIHENDPCF